MMAQNDRVVVGIDVAKDKVDACIRSLSQEQTILSTAAGQRALIRRLRKHKVGKVAMEASGGYERDRARRCARTASRSDRRSQARAQLRPAAGRRAKNDAIDAERSPGSPRPSPTHRAKPTTRHARSWCRS